MRAFWSGFFLSLSLCLDLGLVNIVTLRISLQRGATAGFLLAIGSVAGDLLYFSAVIAGATALLTSRPVRLGLWIIGTLTLLLLAARAIREVFRPKLTPMPDDGPKGDGGLLGLFVTGLGLALASPTAILWFVAIGGSVIASYGVPGGDNRRMLAIFASGFASAGIVWAALFAYGAAALRKLLGWRLMQWLSIASAALFLYFAFDVFTSGWRELRP